MLFSQRTVLRNGRKIVSIVVVGSVAFDSIETPRGEVERAIGGSATYFSIAASYFCPVQLVAVVGEDFGPEYRAILLSKDIGLDGLSVVKGGKTFFWRGRYGLDPNERESLVTELNVFEGFRPELPESYRGAGWLFLGNIDPSLQLEVLEQIETLDFVGLDTMNFWIEGKPRELREVLKRVDVLLINDGEVRQLSGEPNLIKAGEAILGMGPEVVVVKKGEHGAFLLTENLTFFAPPYPLKEVIDPTGAGDSFAGGFVGYLAGASHRGGQELKSAMIYGTIMASYTCESFSVERLKALSEKEIAGRFKELLDLVRVE